MNQGWIKLRRQLLEHPRLAHPGWLHLWATLLLMTNRDRLAQRTGMNAPKIERLLNLMPTEPQIEPVGGVRSRLITIINKAGRQDGEQAAEQLANSARTAREQLPNTHKKARMIRREENLSVVMH